MAKRLLSARLADELDIVLPTLCSMTGKKEGQYITEEEIAEIKSRYDHDDHEVKVNPIDAYQQWEDDEVHFTGKFRRLRRLRRKSLQRGRVDSAILLEYRTPTGHIRLIPETVVTARTRAGQLPYYLLGKDLEKAGVELISAFPGAPTLESECTYCREPLFTRNGQVHAHLRGVLEAVLTDKVKPQKVTFKKRHQECWQAQNILDWIDGAVAEAISEVRMNGGRDPAAEAKAIAEVKARIEERVEGFLAHLRRKQVPASRITMFEQRFAAAIEGMK